MIEELNKPFFRPKFKSEFSMGEYDFKRFDRWLERIELSSAKINSCEVPDLEVVQLFFAELNVIYKSWRSLISAPAITIALDMAIKEAKKQKRIWEQSLSSGIEYNKNMKLKLADLLDEIYTKLLGIKQVIGLGIVVKKSMTPKEKIRYGIKPRTDLMDLPEV